MHDFEEWLKEVCFQKPTVEAYDLAKSAWLKVKKDEELTILKDVMKIAIPSLDPENFENLVKSLNQIARNRHISFEA